MVFAETQLDSTAENPQKLFFRIFPELHAFQDSTEKDNIADSDEQTHSEEEFHVQQSEHQSAGDESSGETRALSGRESKRKVATTKDAKVTCEDSVHASRKTAQATVSACDQSNDETK